MAVITFKMYFLKHNMLSKAIRALLTAYKHNLTSNAEIIIVICQESPNVEAEFLGLVVVLELSFLSSGMIAASISGSPSSPSDKR